MDSESEKQYLEAIGDAKQVIVESDCEIIDFFERIEFEGEPTVYFGTEEGFKKWKLKQVN